VADSLERLDPKAKSTPALRPVIGIVDDDASVLRALKRLLGASGFAVETYGSAEEYLALGHPERADCLLLDIHLGGLSGFELQERLIEARVTTPVIFITAVDDAPTRERARRAGAVEYLLKPLDERVLLEAIREALDSA
jgi:FixJ family two-component response regulator